MNKSRIEFNADGRILSAVIGAKDEDGTPSIIGVYVDRIGVSLNKQEIKVLISFLELALHGAT